METLAVVPSVKTLPWYGYECCFVRTDANTPTERTGMFDSCRRHNQVHGIHRLSGQSGRPFFFYFFPAQVRATTPQCHTATM
jgi:hypothetical protein